MVSRVRIWFLGSVTGSMTVTIAVYKYSLRVYGDVVTFLIIEPIIVPYCQDYVHG